MSVHGIYIFTFQSGDIQICFNADTNSSVKKFTFQSGDIQIQKLAKEVAAKFYNLHSNLVIFKFFSFVLLS